MICVFFNRLGGLESKVDIVVATPGRLVDHINKTPGFSLTDLRFLVSGKWDWRGCDSSLPNK